MVVNRARPPRAKTGLDCVGGRVETSWWSAAVLLGMLAGAAWGGGRSGFAEAPPGCCGAEMATRG